MKYELLNGWKYRLVERLERRTEITGRGHYVAPHFSLSSNGTLTLCAGYAWDGATGVPDTPEIMEASAVHDALYQLMRLGLLDREQYFEYANQLLFTMCCEKGMKMEDAKRIYWGVKTFGKAATYPHKKQKHSIIVIE
jgi:hypothetical protein